MSFDIHFQGFSHGEATEGGENRARRILAPYVTTDRPGDGYVQITVGDGSADVYLGNGGMMANHVAGDGPWDVLVDVARATGWVIMPVGCPVCITDDARRADLPEGLDDDTRVISSGADLLAVITAR